MLVVNNHGLLGQWLNGLNFLELHYLVGKIKFKTFISGFHWLSEMVIVSPHNWGYGTPFQMAVSWRKMNGYLLTNWDDPPSRVVGVSCVFLWGGET